MLSFMFWLRTFKSAAERLLQQLANPKGIKSICPKCGREGTQSITFYKSNPNVKYLRFVHSHNVIHFIGRMRSEAEFIGEMNKPETRQEFEIAMRSMAKEINQLIADYSKTKSGSVERITKSLRGILSRYGY